MPRRRLRRDRSVDAEGATPVIPGFSNLTRIGVGGFSVVYRALQETLGREVALKVLAVDLSDPRASERFRRECRAAGALSHHPNIVTVHDAGVAAQGRPWLSMELCEEGSLADRMRLRGPLPPDEVVLVGHRLAEALDAAHQAGVLHRDVKPENVLVTRSGEPALADFGIAVVAEHRPAAFTQAFSICHAAPEVLEGADPSPAADVYGLGSTLWTLLAGRPPFQEQPGEGMLPFLRRVSSDPVAPLGRPDIPAPLEDALLAALAKHPGSRPPSATAFAAMLRDVHPGGGPTKAGDADRQLVHGFLPPAAPPTAQRPAPAPPAPAHSDPAPPPPPHAPRPDAPPTHAPPTILRRRPETPLGAGPEEGEPRRWPAWQITAVAAALSCVLLGAGTAGLATWGPKPPTKTTTTAAPASGPPPPASSAPPAPPATGPELPPPTNLRATVSSPSTVDLRWEAAATGQAAYTVTTRPAVGEDPRPVPVGQTSFTVGGLSTATTGYCFVVSAVYLLRDRSTRTASSAAACTVPTG